MGAKKNFSSSFLQNNSPKNEDEKKEKEAEKSKKNVFRSKKRYKIHDVITVFFFPKAKGREEKEVERDFCLIGKEREREKRERERGF